jgi:hypothetical protein
MVTGEKQASQVSTMPQLIYEDRMHYISTNSPNGGTPRFQKPVHSRLLFERQATNGTNYIPSDIQAYQYSQPLRDLVQECLHEKPGLRLGLIELKKRV